MSDVPARIDFESIVTNSIDIVTVMQKDGIVQYVSPSSLSILGYPPDELIGKNSFMFIHPLDIGRVMKLVAEGLQHPEMSYMMQLRYKHKQGWWKTLECRAQYLPNASFKGILVHSRDVSDRIEEELRIHSLLESQRKLARAVDQSPSSIVITDRSGLIEYVNPAFVSTTGYSSDEAIGKNPRILQSGKTPQSVYKDMWSTILSGRTWHGELMNKRKNGTFYWESVTFSPVLNDKGEITHFLAIKNEITKEKETREQLVESERQFQQVIQTVSSGIMIHDTDGSIVTANPAAQQILGLTLDQMMGKSLRDPMWKAIHEDGSDFPDATFPVMQSLATGTPQKNVVMGVHKPDGQVSWIMINTVVLGLDEKTKKPSGVIASFNDITIVREATDVLRQKTTDLERMNKLMIGRELKMIELKEQLKELRGEK